MKNNETDKKTTTELASIYLAWLNRRGVPGSKRPMTFKKILLKVAAAMALEEGTFGCFATRDFSLVDRQAVSGRMKMDSARAKELLAPLYSGDARGLSPDWRERMIEALEFVIAHGEAE